MSDIKLKFTNSFTGKKETFIPNDPSHIKMYVCGPTVYDRPHIGNIRSSVVFDLLYRLLKHLYPKVTYVRNITDIDDKIINQAMLNKESESDLTLRITKLFHDDLKGLGCLSPDFEPRATENIQEIVSMIKNLIEKKHAYIAKNHVLFDIESFEYYGKLSNRNKDEMIAGARVEVAPFKKSPMDFVLWKPKKEKEVICFDSPWGRGRPGWHIECSAMSKRHLGDEIDIHGGGIDLIFPHHENEIAQSACANQSSNFVKYWLHNGFLTVNGEKMSKSIGNIITLKELKEKGIKPEVLRYFYFTAHYKKPLDFNMKAIKDAEKSINKINMTLDKYKNDELVDCDKAAIIDLLSNDLNTPNVIAHLYSVMENAACGNKESARELKASCEFLGFNLQEKQLAKSIDPKVIELAEKRLKLKKEKNG